MTPSGKYTLIHVKEGGKRPKSICNYFGDYMDTFILLGGWLFVAASIALVVLALAENGESALQLAENGETIVQSVLQRVIAVSSLTVSSAVMVVVGKRYVFSKLSGNGIRSQRIILYNEVSITSLILHFRFEMLSFALLLYWGSGLVTGLAANNVVGFVSASHRSETQFPAGSLDAQVGSTIAASPCSGNSGGSLDAHVNSTTLFSQISSCLDLIISASELDSSLNDVGTLGVIEINIKEEPTGRMVYPLIPLPPALVGVNFTAPAAVLNGFQIATHNVTSKPDKPPSCTLSGSDIWFVSADTQSFTLVVGRLIDESSCKNVTCDEQTVITQYTATAVTIGGTLYSEASGHTTFVANGTYSNLTMSDSQWAMVMMDVICNASLANGLTVMDFGTIVNLNEYEFGTTPSDGLWSSVLHSIIGSYTVVNINPHWPFVNCIIQTNVASAYNVIVIAFNTLFSVAMLVTAFVLGKQNQLHRAFLNSTRILLDASRNADLFLFNESLGSTVDALGDSQLQVMIQKDFDSDGLLETNIYSSPRETLPSSSSDRIAPHSSLQSNSYSTPHSRTPSEDDVCDERGYRSPPSPN